MTTSTVLQLPKQTTRVSENAPRDLSAPLREWRALLGADAVIDARESARVYGANTAAITRAIPATLRPCEAADVVELVKIAARHRVALYPISTGKNWGYGCANPVTDGCALVDLSGLNRIIAFDRELGTVTVEPGVTQQMLADYLDRHDLAFLVPVTGAGPDASLLGNAMERGYGLTPHADHFAAVMSLEAVLPDGRIYRSALSEAGGEGVDRAFKWGVGPYLDGLFAQGNLGIVTQVTIALAPAPEHVEAFFFSVRQDEQLEAAVVAVREILASVGGVTGSLNLMNTRRVLSMVEPYPAARIPVGRVIPADVVGELAELNEITAWTGVGALYGTKSVVRATRAKIRAALRPFSSRIVFVSLPEIQLARKVSQWIPFLRSSRLARNMERVEAFLQNASGRPSDIALPLAYWKSGNRPAAGKKMDPARDGCGLLWYAPLIPMKPQLVREYVSMVERICTAHGMEPMITLTSLSNRCFDSTVPLLFNRENPEEAARAHACYDALFKAGKELGFLPYRLGVHAMQHMVNAESTFWQLGSAIKRAVDPQNLIAPGRYALQ